MQHLGPFLNAATRQKGNQISMHRTDCLLEAQIEHRILPTLASIGRGSGVLAEWLAGGN